MKLHWRFKLCSLLSNSVLFRGLSFMRLHIHISGEVLIFKHTEYDTRYAEFTLNQEVERGL